MKRSISTAWIGDWPNIAPRAAVAVLGLGLLAQSASILRQQLAPVTPTIARVPMEEPVRLQASPLDVAAINAAHLFGDSATGAAAVPPDSTAPLTLVGTVSASGRPHDGLAIVRAETQQNRLLRVGEMLDATTTLRAVYSSRVVIERANRLETIWLVSLLPHLAPGPGATPANDAMNAIAAAGESADDQPGAPYGTNSADPPIVAEGGEGAPESHES